MRINNEKSIGAVVEFGAKQSRSARQRHNYRPVWQRNCELDDFIPKQGRG
jgi:hypothetical protein